MMTVKTKAAVPSLWAKAYYKQRRLAGTHQIVWFFEHDDAELRLLSFKKLSSYVRCRKQPTIHGL